MEFHTGVRNVGVVGKVLKANRATRDTSTAARAASKKVLLLVMSAIESQLKGWGNGVSPVPPKAARRAQPPAYRGTYLSDGMIKASMHHRVIILSRRDDWP